MVRGNSLLVGKIIVHASLNDLHFTKLLSDNAINFCFDIHSDLVCFYQRDHITFLDALPNSSSPFDNCPLQKHQIDFG